MQTASENQYLQHNNIILFDGVCNLCNGIVNFIIRKDKKGTFKFAALQSQAGQSLLQIAGLPQQQLQTIVYICKGRYYTRSDAALQVAQSLGGFWKLFFPLIIIPRPVRDFLYNLVAKYRYHLFGRKDSCMIPTPEIMNRFL